jgi:hypothetical protein
MKYNIMDAATLGVFDLSHAPKSAMKATDCSQHRQAAGAIRSKKLDRLRRADPNASEWRPRSLSRL